MTRFETLRAHDAVTMTKTKLLIAVAALLTAATVLNAVGDRPNILYIMSDDHAAQAISAYGSKINKTPNIDRIASGGMRFTNCFVTNSICTPSRAAILTGKYSHKNGVPVFNKIDSSQPTLAKYFLMDALIIPPQVVFNVSTFALLLEAEASSEEPHRLHELTQEYHLPLEEILAEVLPSFSLAFEAPAALAAA